MIDVLQLSPYAPNEINEELEKCTSLARYWDLQQNEELRAQTLPNIRIVATKGDVGLSGELMAELPSLELIVVYGAGYDKIDLKQARDRNIIITTTPDALTEAVADHVVALALASSRRIAEGDRFIRNGDWLNGKLGIGYSLRGKTLGIFGYGRIGRKTAEILGGTFGMQVLYCDRSADPKQDRQCRSSPLELASESDVLVIAASGSPDTKNIIDINILEALGPNGLLINIARGSLVNTQHLITALESRKLGAAALDVFLDEPNVPNELINSPYTTLTPHLASATRETRVEMGRQVIENISSYRKNGEVFNRLIF
ncbi:2-hydroxyacid dehydrogenase [Pseudovibrio sp. WM33]|uniref:2-hydroxyacid dehydrogenase n=1 Tax=Pseudovibrio sp. WM33 TaxID=1735585 RepID=UPI0007AEA15F|nr:2-hydroxyacid dehydrogenase [Pseudovibrio sp. WM33]KZL26367.1 Glyoxylate/hydroxypyruvate reductase B [Pseudovibrio sp. WM33]